MQILVIVLSLALLSMYVFVARFCANPYVLYCIVGSKGSGKSLFLSKYANNWVNKHKGDVYSNMDIGLPLPEKYWEHEYPYGSLILIDEIGVIHPDRGFKSFPTECMEWYKMSRKRGLTILCSSQTMDFDKKIRMLCDRIFVCHRFSFFSLAVPFKACITTCETPEGGHDLVNDIKKAGLPNLCIIPKVGHDVSLMGYDTNQIIKAKGKKDGGAVG